MRSYCLALLICCSHKWLSFCICTTIANTVIKALYRLRVSWTFFYCFFARRFTFLWWSRGFWRKIYKILLENLGIWAWMIIWDIIILIFLTVQWHYLGLTECLIISINLVWRLVQEILLCSFSIYSKKFHLWYPCL